MNALTVDKLLLRHEVEAFLTHEAEILDERRFEDWFALMAQDLRYWMPVTRNVPMGKYDGEHTRERQDLNWFDEGHFEMEQRIKQLRTGKHWVEDPVSRTCHMFSNLVVSEDNDGLDQDLIRARCRFIVYRNRTEIETDLFVGKREDHLRRVTRDGDDSFEIARRQIFLDQNVLLAKSLSTFF
jgi:3-phenylpropionate/cinnamic acid dioxygenase small subunit